jgi:hypothetical protein
MVTTRCTFDRLAVDGLQGDDGAIVAIVPGWTVTLHRSLYAITALPPGSTMTESPALASTRPLIGAKP